MPMGRSDHAMALREHVDRALLWLDAFDLRLKLRDNGGLYDNQTGASCPDYPVQKEWSPFSCPPIGLDPGEGVIKLAQLANVFYIWALGIGLGILVYMIELLTVCFG